MQDYVRPGVPHLSSVKDFFHKFLEYRFYF